MALDQGRMTEMVKVHHIKDKQRYNQLGNPVEMWPVLKALTEIVSG
jgi:hypothetical protein